MLFDLVFRLSSTLPLFATLLAYIVAVGVLLLRGSKTRVMRLITLIVAALAGLALSLIVLKVISDGLFLAYMDT